MPRRSSSLKSQRVDKKRRLRNLKIKQRIKKTLKKFQALLLTKKTEQAQALLRNIYSLLDKAAKKRIIHPNLANRKKSRLTRKILKIK